MLRDEALDAGGVTGHEAIASVQHEVVHALAPQSACFGRLNCKGASRAA